MGKKILFVANVAKEHILKFHLPTIREFKKQGWTVDVACAGEETIPECDRQYRMPWKRSPFSWKTIQGIVALKKIIDREAYDIIYCHTPVGGMAARLAAAAARKRGTKVIYCAHGFHFYKNAPRINWLVYYPVEKLLAHLTDVLFTVNREDYENAKRRFTKKVKIELVPEVGVDFGRLQIGDREEIRRQYRDQLQIPQDAFVMIYVAELIPNKNQRMLIDALKILRDRGKNAFLLLPGPEHDDGDTKGYADEMGMTAYCRFLGWRNDVGQLMVSADVCTASSIREGFGINLVEAMYCGLPVVATDNRGHQMVVQDELNGYLVPVGDSSLMAERVEKLCDSEELRKRLSQQDVSSYDCYRIAEILYQRITGV